MTDYAYRVVTINLASAVTNFPVEIEGSVIMHLTGTANITIKLNSRSQDAIYLSPRDRIVMPPGMTFKKFYVSGSAGGGTVTLFVGRPNMLVDAGQVYVAGNVDIGKDIHDTQNVIGNQNQFIMAGRLNPGAADFGCLQVYNPASSGYDLYMQSARIKVQSATPIRIKAGPYDTNMTGGTGTGTCTYAIPRNKYDYSHVGTVYGMSYGYKFVAVAPDPLETHDCYVEDVDGFVEFIKKEAVRIKEGYGFVFAPQTVNIDYDCIYEFTIVSNT